MPDITLRPLLDDDLAIFFEQQQEPEALWMAAFTAKDPADRAAFQRHWARIRADDTITIRTILAGEHVAGYITRHSWFGDPEVSYWLGRAYWGRGIATRALQRFLELIAERPLYARVAQDNLASLRVLQRCGFVIAGADRGFANARDAEIDEWVLRLVAPAEEDEARNTNADHSAMS